MPSYSSTPYQAFTYANFMTKEMKLSSVAMEILDEASSRVWNAAAWPWTIAYLGTVDLVAGQVDYVLSIPADFYDIYKAILFDADNVFKPLNVDPLLPSTPGRVGETISVAATASGIRIYPAPPTPLPSTQQKILLYYKKTAPRITSANATSAGAFSCEDQWFYLYKSAVLINAYKYADDARGFDITRDNQGSTKFGGELANFEYLIGDVKKSQPFMFEWDIYSEAKGESR